MKRIATAAIVSPAEMRAMLQSLLVERFKLKVRRETKTAPSYESVIARGDGTLTPQLRKSEIDCAALGPNPPVAPTSSKAWCGLRGTGPGGKITAQPGPDAPFLGAALDDQLGLKLVPSERPMEFLVIDDVQPPTPD